MTKLRSVTADVAAGDQALVNTNVSEKGKFSTSREPVSHGNATPAPFTTAVRNSGPSVLWYDSR